MTFTQRRAALAAIVAAAAASYTATAQTPWDSYCQAVNGPESYCKTWQSPVVCFRGDQPCGTGPVPDYTTTPSPSSTRPTSGPTGPSCDSYCMELNGPRSYCKYWMADPVCLNGDQPCDPTTCAAAATASPRPTGPATTPVAGCDQYCQGINGAHSYCKYWMPQPVCLGGNQPCGTEQICSGPPPSTPEPGASTPSATTRSPACDSFCVGLNGPTSYCKYWMPLPVCLGGNQICDASTCGTTGPAATTTTTSSSEPSGGGNELTTVAPSTSTPAGATTPRPQSPGCDSYCRNLNGPKSYCKFWLSPSVCLGGNQPCEATTCDLPSTKPSAPETTAATTTTTQAATTASSAAATTTTTTTSEPQGGGNELSTVNPEPTIPPRPSTTPHATIPSTRPQEPTQRPQSPTPPRQSTPRPESPGCNSYCRDLNGPKSYCKFWQTPSVCLGGNQPCNASDCDLPPTRPPGGPSDMPSTRPPGGPSDMPSTRPPGGPTTATMPPATTATLPVSTTSSPTYTVATVPAETTVVTVAPDTTTAAASATTAAPPVSTAATAAPATSTAAAPATTGAPTTTTGQQGGGNEVTGSPGSQPTPCDICVEHCIVTFVLTRGLHEPLCKQYLCPQLCAGN